MGTKLAWLQSWHTADVRKDLHKNIIPFELTHTRRINFSNNTYTQLKDAKYNLSNGIES